MIEIETNNYVHALAYQVQKEGKSVCGDSFFMKATAEYFICAVSDGLGSGERANDSSSAISEVVEHYHHEDVDHLIERCNRVLKDKRGATVSIFKINYAKKEFTYSSVGNIRFVLFSPSGKFIYPLPILGYLSGKPQKYRTDTFPYEKGSRFIIHTDGLILPTIKSLLKDHGTVEEISNHLESYTKLRIDDLTYIVGQLS